MTRVVAIAVGLSLACSPRARIVGGTAFVGGIGVGLPLAHECTPEQPGDCGASRYAAFIVGGAAVGALLGLWVQREWRLQQREQPTAPPEMPRRQAVVETIVKPLPVVDAPAIDLPGSPLGGYAEGDGSAAVCIDAKRGVAAALEARCAYEHQGGLLEHSILEAPCTCNRVEDRRTDSCYVLADATCAATDGAFVALGFATERELAEDDARAACTARGGTAGVVTSSCSCADGICGCVADAACDPS